MRDDECNMFIQIFRGSSFSETIGQCLQKRPIGIPTSGISGGSACKAPAYRWRLNGNGESGGPGEGESVKKVRWICGQLESLQRQTYNKQTRAKGLILHISPLYDTVCFKVFFSFFASIVMRLFEQTYRIFTTNLCVDCGTETPRCRVFCPLVVRSKACDPSQKDTLLRFWAEFFIAQN